MQKLVGRDLTLESATESLRKSKGLVGLRNIYHASPGISLWGVIDYLKKTYNFAFTKDIKVYKGREG